jgi:dTDP-4-dehydrorhamnose reductase
MPKKSIVILGASGQVGKALFASFANHFPKTKFPEIELHLLSRREADLANLNSLENLFERYMPSIVLNAAAYTKVDLAEKEEKLALTINSEAPKLLANQCAELKIPFVHFSTDYVFSDPSKDSSNDSSKDASKNYLRPHKEDDPTDPINAYGRSKLAGEQEVRKAGGQHLIFRTSWVFDAHGSNFLNTMLKLGAEREKLSIVNDQFGAPTYAPHLADAVVHAVRPWIFDEGEVTSGIYHLTGSGEASWFDFATEIFLNARSKKIPLKLKDLLPVSSEEFQTAAKRPRNSRLDNTKFQQTFYKQLPDWKDGVRECFELK